MKTPDYVLNEDLEILDEHWNKNIVPAGTFVKPLDYYYVPKHVRDLPLNKFYDDKTESFCYSSYGIIIVPDKKIRRV